MSETSQFPPVPTPTPGPSKLWVRILIAAVSAVLGALGYVSL